MNIQADVRKRESMSALQCSPTKKKLRSSLTDSDWTNTCFICDKQANKAAESKKAVSDRQIISTVQDHTTKESILDEIKDRRDDFRRNIHRRLISTEDLVAVEAVYHSKCFSHLMLSNKHKSRNHPKTSIIDTAMEQIYTYIEDNSDYQFSLSEVKQLLTDYLPDNKTIKSRLSERYKDISFLPLNSRICQLLRYSYLKINCMIS